MINNKPKKENPTLEIKWTTREAIPFVSLWEL